MTTPNPTPEALQRQEAEKRVIELGREIATIVQQIIDKETTEPHLFIKCGEMLHAVNKLNALSSPSEPQPTTGDQQAEEFEGWNVWRSDGGLLCVEHGRDVWAKCGDKWVLQDVIYRNGKWHRLAYYEAVTGPARLEVLRSLPPEILNAPKGGKS